MTTQNPNLVNFGPTAPAPDRVVQPVVPTQTRPIVVDTGKRPVATLGGYVDGIPARVHWYSQVNDGQMGTYGYDKGKSASVQQFIKIHNLEIRLDGDFTPTQNPQDKTFTVEGGAHVTTGVVPNVGDVFSYEAGDGRYAVYQVNESIRTTAMNAAVYRVRFTRIFYTSDPRYVDLENKVVEGGRMYYIKEYAQFGRDPVVTTAVYEDLRALHKLQGEMAEDFIRSFTNREYGFLAVPFQVATTYDPFLAEAFRALIDPSRHPAIQRVRFYKYAQDGSYNQPTIWDVVLQRRPDLLVDCRSKSEMTRFTNFVPMPTLLSLRYCGADNLVLPQSETDGGFQRYDYTETWAPLPGPTPKGPMEAFLSTTINGPAATLPKLHPVCKDGYYVLSEAFYKRDPAGYSLLEKLMWDYLERDALRSDLVRHLASNYRVWEPAQRFYYTPLVLVLIQMCLMNGSQADL